MNTQLTIKIKKVENDTSKISHQKSSNNEKRKKDQPYL